MAREETNGERDRLAAKQLARLALTVGLLNMKRVSTATESDRLIGIAGRELQARADDARRFRSAPTSAANGPEPAQALPARTLLEDARREVQSTIAVHAVATCAFTISLSRLDIQRSQRLDDWHYAARSHALEALTRISHASALATAAEDAVVIANWFPAGTPGFDHWMSTTEQLMFDATRTANSTLDCLQSMRAALRLQLDEAAKVVTDQLLRV